ncbi:hypothetical protein PVK06_041620 [Gossypium arboreum]|uniref:Uncharacterized protein n=1 Tax=Gossypium arboreum TaxID=29729 RepID=A0ABR0N9B2_GOSAR|nr:hypothetical protein PVK06_041620 [Gossypium arboreum]
MELENEETEIQYVPNEINLGVADDMGKGKERAMKDVRDMGLDIVEVPLDDPKVGGGDIGLGIVVGCRNEGISNSKEFICLVEGDISSQESVLVRGDRWETTLEVKEELKWVLFRRKKKKGLNKKIQSMYEIQNSILTLKERKKRDRALHKERGRESCKEDERIVNLSLSDSDISNRMRVILREANNT